MMLDHFTVNATGHYTMLVSVELERVGVKIAGLAILARMNLRTPPRGVAPFRTLNGDEVRPGAPELLAHRYRALCGHPDFSAPLSGWGKGTASVLLPR
jgi:hypothetical protein